MILSAFPLALYPVRGVQGPSMKKPTPVILYPGVVLHSSGMIVIPQVPKPKSHKARLPIVVNAAMPVRNTPQLKRK